MASLKRRESLAPDPDPDDALRSAADRLGHRFADLDLLRQALTHASLPRAGRPCASERLEFLGDAVVNLAVSELLFERQPKWSEGQLSLARADCVRTGSLARKARAYGLDGALRLGRGEEKSGGRHKVSILAAAYESAMGAVFLDAGYAVARNLIRAHFATELGEQTPGERDFKTRLQERAQASFGVAPQYRLMHTAGPDHAREFVVAVEIAGRIVGEGRGPSKRAAEQQAASRALQQTSDERELGKG